MQSHRGRPQGSRRYALREYENNVDRSAKEHAVDSTIKNPSFPNASDCKYPQDEECYGYLAGGDGHDAEWL